ncbi:hypothetical protein [Pontibacter beigongshangensis]|uniref:hypothetical protein n=1 Tax=Pontibacter beigongshangensis TaxID=2574733 RepID=UPI0016507391|nr:hypothetical protein [Pontibacter beigongshangensis]
MNITLTIEEKYISFRDADDNIIYDIRKCDLGESYNYPEGQISFWIYELVAKKWATKPMLIQLFEIMKLEAPDSKMDWEETREFIEYHY